MVHSISREEMRARWVFLYDFRSLVTYVLNQIREGLKRSWLGQADSRHTYRNSYIGHCTLAYMAVRCGRPREECETDWKTDD